MEDVFGVVVRAVHDEYFHVGKVAYEFPGDSGGALDGVVYDLGLG